MIASSFIFEREETTMAQTKKQAAGTKPAVKSNGSSAKQPVAKAAGVNGKNVIPPGKAAAKPAAKAARLDQKDRQRIREMLLTMREDLVGQVSHLKNDSLRRDDEVNTVEDGTDAFERQFALSLASTEQEAVSQINEALRQLEEGTYGACEHCQNAIEKARLEALPFVKTCIICQSELEKSGSRSRAGMGAQAMEPWDESRTPGAGQVEEEE
jgi:RNA polymerase-binding transcription factor DksA